MTLTPTEETYTSNENRNVLEMIWQFDTDNTIGNKKQLTPKIPILIIKKDFIIDSYRPVEVGISYGFDYWTVKGKDIK